MHGNGFSLIIACCICSQWQQPTLPQPCQWSFDANCILNRNKRSLFKRFVLGMTLNCICHKGNSPGALGSTEFAFMTMTLWCRDRVQSMSHIDLFANYSYWIGIHEGYHIETSYCDSKIIKILGWANIRKRVGTGAIKYCVYSKWEFIFRTCEDRAAWHLIPCRISSS